MLNLELEKLFKRVIQTIRVVDKNHIVMVSGSMWGQDYSIFKDWNYDDKLMFTCHRYHFSIAPEKPGIQDFIDYRAKFQRPFYMGETGHEPDEWISGCVKLLDSLNIGWTFWPYKKMGMAVPENLPDTAALKKTAIRSRTAMTIIEMPAQWKLVQDFADADRSTHEAIRKARPNQDAVKAVLNELLEKMKWRYCTVNEGYVRALGMKPF